LEGTQPAQAATRGRHGAWAPGRGLRCLAPAVL